MKQAFIIAVLLTWFCSRTNDHAVIHETRPRATIETDLFDEAVECIKQSEGWHEERHHPYVGYGHRILPDERGKLTFRITKQQADSLLRLDLKKKCAMFRKYGKDSLLLGTLAYNVGEYTLLGCKSKPKSKLITKLDSGDRDIREEYISFRKYRGRVIPSIQKRREREFDLLFNKTKTIHE